MKLRERMSSIGALIALTCSGVVFSAEFGRIQGTFDASPTGSASYRIPLWTPAGPQGVEPEITLVYDSQLGGGIAGVGWGLDAVPSIERCPRSVSLDGVVGTIQFNYDDRFCLRGNRLRLTSAAGTYGQALSTYQLVQDDFTKITAYGATGNGPTYFRAQGKNGLTYEYGFTDNSRVLPGNANALGTSVYRWLLNKVTDRSGLPQRKSRNATADIFVTDDMWRNQSPRTFRVYIATEVGNAVCAIADRAREHGDDLETDRLLSDIAAATGKFLQH